MQNGLLEINPSAQPVPRPVWHPQVEAEVAETGNTAQFRDAQRRTSSFSYAVSKRAVDLAVCFALLVLLGPFLVVLAIMVRLSSPGPVLYRETRIGRFGKKFTIYKFRSMYTREHLIRTLGYEECEIAQLRQRQHGKGTADPRVTPIGGVFRVTSLDELPQLFNVIRGDMSLIGPRPVVAAELTTYGEDAPLYKAVYPGISGLWQVSGRSNLSFAERVRLDARYCLEWTFWGDFAIALRTLPAVLKRNGAY